MEDTLEKQAKKLSELLLLEQERLNLNEVEMAIRCEISEREYQYLISGKLRSEKSKGYYTDTLNKIFRNTNIVCCDIFMK